MRKIFIGLLVLVSILFTGCQAKPSDNKFSDDKLINVEYLKQNNCLFFDNLAFGEDSDKNHVFVIENGEVKEHHRYDAVEFKAENFTYVHNKSLIEAVKYIGIPSFYGTSNELSLDYICPDGYIRRLKMSKNKGELVIKNIEELDFDDPFWSLSWFDPEKTDLPTLEECKAIRIGMPIDEVIRKIGKPQRDIGYGAFLFQFDIDDGSTLQIMFDRRRGKYHANYLFAEVIEIIPKQ